MLCMRAIQLVSDNITDVSIPHKFAFFHCGKKVFAGSNALLNSVLYFHVGDMVSVGDAK